MPEMVAKAMSFVKDPKDLLELYCGSGTFSLPMRKLFNKIFATENNRQSIRCIKKSIDEQSIKNIFMQDFQLKRFPNYLQAEFLKE
jgi:tRNA (uracil-5-)-methyltransferase